MCTSVNMCLCFTLFVLCVCVCVCTHVCDRVGVCVPARVPRRISEILVSHMWREQES